MPSSSTPSPTTNYAMRCEMGKYLFPELTDTLAAVVSDHGWFQIQERRTFTGYSDGVGPVFRDGRQLPGPVVVHEGSAGELGLAWDARGFLGEEFDAEDDGYGYVETRLLEYLATR